MVNPDRNLYEPPYDDALLYESDLEPERPRSRPLVVLLGIVVLAAFAGVVWVAYNQGVKHGQGGVPILSAEAGPTRVPADGAAAEPKDVAADKSYDRLFGDASEQTENVLPPAEQPRAVATSADPAAPQEITDATAAGGPQANVVTDLQPPGADPRMDSNTGVTGIAPSAPQPISSAPPTPLPSGSEDITNTLSPVESVPAPPAKIAAVKPAAPKVVTPAVSKPSIATPAVTMPIKPPPAAAVIETPAPAPVEAPTALTAPTESVTTQASAGGSVMIQLGSFPNDKLAAGAWSKIKSSNQELLGDYKPTIKSAEIEGKGTWYRLRVGGFADKASAANVCEQLKANGQACIIASK
jgi:cell division protein FtsN